MQGMVETSHLRTMFYLYLIGLLAVLSVLSCFASIAYADDGNDTVVWSNARAKVVAVGIDDGITEGYSKIEMFAHGRQIYLSGNGYLNSAISILWQRKAGSTKGPNVIIGGGTGGSACGVDVTVLDLADHPPVQTIFVCGDEVPIKDENGLPSLDIWLEVEALATNASETSYATLPLRWTGDRFDVDFAKMLKPNPSPNDIEKIKKRIGTELGAMTGDDETEAPATCQALLDLAFSGHADVARSVLFSAWPTKLKGREAYWQVLSTALVKHRFWKQFNLQRLPYSDLIISAARTSQ